MSRTDKSIAKEIFNDPGTRHLTPDQRQILVAETLQLLKSMRADFKLRFKPLKPPKPPKPPRPPRRNKISLVELIVAAHMHRCGMSWRQIGPLLGHGKNGPGLCTGVKRAGLRTQPPKPEKSITPKPPRIPKPRKVAPIPRPPKSSQVEHWWFDVTPPRVPKKSGPKPGTTRRFDWARALEMRNAGISNLEIAKWAGVTPEAVCGAVKKMKKAAEANKSAAA